MGLTEQDEALLLGQARPSTVAGALDGVRLTPESARRDCLQRATAADGTAVTPLSGLCCQRIRLLVGQLRGA